MSYRQPSCDRLAMVKELKRNDILWKMTILLYFAMENYLFIEKQHINIMYKSISGPFSWAKLPESSSDYIYSTPCHWSAMMKESIDRTQLAIDSHGNAGSCPIWALAKKYTTKTNRNLFKGAESNWNNHHQPASHHSHPQWVPISDPNLLTPSGRGY